MQQSSSPVDTSFENTLFVDTPLIGEELKKIDKSHGGSLNHWVGGLMYITVQNLCGLQYLTMRLSGYMNAPTEPTLFLSNMAWDIPCKIYMNQSCTQERKFIELMKSPSNVTSKQGMQK